MMHRTLILLVILQLAAIAFVCINNWNSARLFLTDDLTFCLAIGQQFADGFAALVGLPSHKGERHLGPFYPWLSGIAALLFNGNIEQIFLFFTALKLIGLALFAYLTCKIAGASRALPILILFLAAISGSNYLWLIRFEWVNNLIPTFCIINLVFLLLSFRNWQHSPKFIFSSVILANFHLGTIPMLIAQHVCLAGYYVFTRQTNNYSLKKIITPSNIIAVFGSAALLLASLYYELKFNSNFINQIALQSSVVEKPAGLFLALSALLKTLGIMTFTSDVGATTPQILAWVIFLCALVTALLLFLRKNQSEICFLLLSSLAALILTTIGAAKQQAPLSDFFFYPVVPLFWLLGICYAVLILAKITLRPVILSCVIVPLVLFQLVALNKQQKGFSQTPFWPYLSISHVEEFTKLIAKETNHQPVKFFTRGNQNLRSAAYQWIYSKRDVRSLHYGERMLELPMSQKAKKPNFAVLIDCPLNNRDINDVITKNKKISRFWQLERQLDLASCQSCQHCQSVLLRRKVAP